MKYYFLVYSHEAPYEGHIENIVINIHPFEFLGFNLNLRIVFYKEITEEEYIYYLENIYSV